MDKAELKILRKIVGEGYKLKAQHNNPEWREALESAEGLLIDEKAKLKEVEPIPGLDMQHIIKEAVKYGMYLADPMTDQITANDEGLDYYNEIKSELGVK